MTVIESEHDSDNIYKLSPEEIAAIKEGLLQIENSQYLSDEDANRQIEEWLKK